MRPRTGPYICVNTAFISLPIRENFLSAYRLPSTYSAPDVFGSAVVALIKLVQSALALFNMGPLKTGPFAILQPDGLLCDSTLNELTKWQFDVAEPFLSTEVSETDYIIYMPASRHLRRRSGHQLMIGLDKI